MTDLEKKIPAFFNVYIPESCSVRMQIPRAFTCYMKGKLRDSRAFLRNGRGNVWAVGVIREGGDLYFEKGWVRFVEDNKVEMGDFLVFQFSGDNIYDFKHLGTSGCQKETDEEGEEDNEEEEDNEDEDEDYMDEEAGKNKGKAGVEYEGRGSKKSIKRKILATIFNTGLINPPRNPYFVAQPTKQNDLHIPFDVINDHRLVIPEKIIISSQDGWEFTAKVTTRGDGRRCITDGYWKAFQAHYRVKKEEWCLCEFVPPENHKLLLRVLHFHAGKWIPRT